MVMTPTTRPGGGASRRAQAIVLAALSLMADGPLTAADPVRDDIPESLKPVLKQLSDPEVEVRRKAIETIHELGEAALPGVKVVLVACRDRDEDVRSIATAVLESLGTAAVGKLAEALSDPAATVRAEAADWLACLKGAAARALPALGARLDDPDAPARVAAARAVLAVGGPEPRAEAVLVKALRSGAVAAVRALAAEGLRRSKKTRGDVAQALLEGLQGTPPEVRLSAADSLLELGTGTDRAVAALAALLPPGACNEKLSENAATRLGKAGEPARRVLPQIVAAFLAFRRLPEPQSRFDYLMAVVELGDLDTMIGVLRAEPLAIQEDNLADGFHALMLEHPEKATMLAELLEPGPADAPNASDREELRRFVAECLAALGPKARAARPALERALNDRSPNVRAAARKALNAIGPQDM
jgi:HEAT repeat protein